MAKFKKVRTREDALKSARRHLKNNVNLSGANLYVLPDGTQLRVRVKEAGRLSVENYNTKIKSDNKRSKAAQPKGEDEAAFVRSQKQLARQQSDDLVHQIAADGRPSIAEHNRRLASGGSNESMSISPPDFKTYKDTVETKIQSKFGDQFVVDVDDVSGGVRAIPASKHNPYEAPSKQKGITFEQGQEVDFTQLEKMVKNGNGNGNGIANGVPNGNGGSTSVIVDSARQAITVKPAKSFDDILKLLRALA